MNVANSSLVVFSRLGDRGSMPAMTQDGPDPVSKALYPTLFIIPFGMLMTN